MTTLDDESVSQAIVHLRSVDPAMGALIDRVGPCAFRPQREGTHFEALARAIVYQQLSGRAAEAIYNRFAALLDGTPTPERLGELNLDTLRTAGLSRPKASYLLDLAAKCVSGDLDIQNLHEHDDDGIIQQLTSVKGVGRWTSQMFLLFRLGRPDIFSELDLGMRKGVQKLYGLPELPSFQETAEFGAKWAPHRSVASWYLWRSLE